jgi:hypothetical protein
MQQAMDRVESQFADWRRSRTKRGSDYLNRIQRNQLEVKANPAVWLPWLMPAESG